MKKILVVLLVMSAVGCSSKGDNKSSQPSQQNTAFMTSSAVPAAQGNVTTQQDPNGNTIVDVTVQHLAPPQNLAPGAQTYVVWVQPSGQDGYQNVGAMKVNKDLQGNYRTKVPFKNFTIMVTPESSQTVTEPTNNAVLEKSVNI